MTEPTATLPTGEPVLTPSAVHADQLDRVAQLRARRAAAVTGPPAEQAGPAGAIASRQPKRRRRHVAQGSRILAAGLGATTMFGIVTVLGLHNPVNGETNPVDTVARTLPPTPVAPPVQVVVHRVPTTTPSTVSGEASAEITPAAAAHAAPIQLTANPVVQTITVAAPSQPQSSSQSRSQSSAGSAPAPAPATTKGSG